MRGYNIIWKGWVIQVNNQSREKSPEKWFKQNITSAFLPWKVYNSGRRYWGGGGTSIYEEKKRFSLLPPNSLVLFSYVPVLPAVGFLLLETIATILINSWIFTKLFFLWLPSICYRMQRWRIIKRTYLLILIRTVGSDAVLDQGTCCWECWSVSFLL